MMAAEAALGYVVPKLLDEVVKSIRLLKNRTENLQKLQGLLDRSQPSVKKLCSSLQNEEHPAYKWLTELREQLEVCHDFIKASRKVWRNIFRFLRTSKESVQLYESISTLLHEASLQQWASGLSFQSIFTENDAKILAEMRATLQGCEQQYQKIANLRQSQADIRHEISKLEQIGPCSSSSAIPSETLSTSSSAYNVSFPDFEILDGSPSSATHHIHRMDSAFDIPEPKVTFGGDVVAQDLINYILSSDCKKWVALYGMGGIGKTCTASKVCHDSKIKQHFSGGILSLTVSKDQPEVDSLYRQLLCKIEGHDALCRLPKESGAAKSYLKGKLDRERVLLVLDDVWQKDVLEQLDVIPDDKECVVLVTTRDQKVFGRKIRGGKMFEIPRLSAEESWQLFSYHAFCGCEGTVPPEVDALAKDVAKECGGLPLALEVIGSTMADKDPVPAERALGQNTLRVWEIALVRLRNANVGNNEYDALYSKLQLSVDCLGEQDPRLRDCFLYFAAFPEDEEIIVEDLVRMWIAEGVVQDDFNSSVSAEEEGRILLAFLVAKSMVEVTGNGRYTKIHDVLRDVARQNMIWDWSTDSAKTCLYAAGMHKSELPTEWTDPATSSSAERLSLQNNDLRQFPEPKQFDAPHLQVLILGQNRSLRSLSGNFFQNLPQLRVLNLSRTGIKKIPDVLLRKLESLVLLDLSHCSKLQKISDKIDGLLNLKFLLFDGCRSLLTLPKVNNLTKLTLYYATVPQRVANVSGENRSLKDRSRKDLSRKDCGKQGISYTFPPNLRELKLDFRIPKNISRSAANYYLLDVSSLCCLEQLALQSFVNRYPAGIEDLHHLKALTIQGRHCQSPLPALDRLPRLEYLKLSVKNDLKSFRYEGAFPKLKKVWIRCLEGIEKTLVFNEGMMPKIESLTVVMRKGEHIPTSIATLQNLKRIILEVNPGEQIREEDLEFVFKQPDCFPHLQELRVREIVREDQKPSVRNLADRLPIHIVERGNHGDLTIGYQLFYNSHRPHPDVNVVDYQTGAS